VKYIQKTRWSKTRRRRNKLKYCLLVRWRTIRYRKKEGTRKTDKSTAEAARNVKQKLYRQEMLTVVVVLCFFGLKWRYDNGGGGVFSVLGIMEYTQTPELWEFTCELYFFSLLFPFHFPRSFIASSPAPLSGYGKKTSQQQHHHHHQPSGEASSLKSSKLLVVEGKFGGRKGRSSKQYQTVIKRYRRGINDAATLKKYFTRERFAAFQEQKSHFPPQFVGDCKTGNTSQVIFKHQ